MSTGVVIGLDGLDELVKVVVARGFRAVGPVVADGAIALKEIEGAADLPAGWQDRQAPGRYELTQTGGHRLFDWAVGPHSVKAEVFPPKATVWRAKPPDYHVEEVEDVTAPVAVIGVRPCDLAGLEVLGRALDGATVPDPTYRRRRRSAFLVAVECTRPASTCFCVAMGTGPGRRQRLRHSPHRTRWGRRGRRSPGGRRSSVPGPGRLAIGQGGALGPSPEAGRRKRPFPKGDAAGTSRFAHGPWCRHRRPARTYGPQPGQPALGRSGRALPRLRQLHIRMPDCFCSNFEDTTDLQGTVERRRTWASCSDLAYSYVHGGPVRSSIKSRYRQWATHKFSWWWDQFGISGCVGCGRCITWCPAGIDITEEIAALRASDGAGEQ